MSYLRCLSLCSTAVHGREPKWMPQRGSNSCCLRLCILPRWNWSNIFPRPLLVALCGAARFGVPPFASANLLDHCRCRPAHANGGQHEHFGSLRQGTLALTLKSQHYLCDWSCLEHRKNTHSKCSRATANIWWFGFREFVLCRNESKRLCTICNCRKEQSFWDHSYLRKAGCVPVQLCRWAELTNAKCLGCPASDAFPPFGLAQGWLVTSPLVASAISSGSALPEPIADATARFFFFWLVHNAASRWHSVSSPSRCVAPKYSGVPHCVIPRLKKGLKNCSVLSSMMLGVGNTLYAVDWRNDLRSQFKASPRLNSGCACGRILFACASVSETLQP